MSLMFWWGCSCLFVSSCFCILLFLSGHACFDGLVRMVSVCTPTSLAAVCVLMWYFSNTGFCCSEGGEREIVTTDASPTLWVKPFTWLSSELQFASGFQSKIAMCFPLFWFLNWFWYFILKPEMLVGSWFYPVIWEEPAHPGKQVYLLFLLRVGFWQLFKKLR